MPPPAAIRDRRFAPAILGCTLVAGLGLVAPELLGTRTLALVGAVLRALDWLLMAIAGGLVVLTAWLALGPHAHRRLGRARARDL